MKCKVILPDLTELNLEVKENTTVEELLTSIQWKYPILSCRIFQRYRRLDKVIKEDCEIELFDLKNAYANMSYQMSLIMIYLKAVKEVAGNKATVHIANSISKGLFTTIHHTEMSKYELAERVEKKIHEIVDANLSITQVKVDRDTLLKAVDTDEAFRYEKRIVKSAYDLHDGFITELDDVKHIFYQYLLPSTKYLNLFELKVYRKGIVLRFPHPNDPNHLIPFSEQNLLYEAFSEEKIWENLLGVKEVSDLNESIINKDYKNLILLSEALHEKKIADIANTIQRNKKRIVLIAGPSSSGKTSFAKRLCIQLQVIGLKPLYLGTDDYFVERVDVPVGEDGKQDFEALSAVDVDLFTKQMNDLLDHKVVDLPEFDFVKGEKVYGKRITQLSDDQIIVIEGIHGLNPKLTEGIADKEKFKIYISPLTQLTIDRFHRIPTTDARMLRRMVRDNRTRNTNAEKTIESWTSVRNGEEKNIFPFNDEADVFFNSQCVYELAILKKYAEPLLKEISNDSPQYEEAQRMLKFLEFFVTLQDESCIPNNSIIREFIGGSVIAS